MSVSARNELLQLIRQKRVVASRGTVIVAHFEIPAAHQATSSVTSMRARVASAALMGAAQVISVNPWLFAVAADAKQAAKVHQNFRKIDEFLEIRKLGRLKTEAYTLPDDAHRIFAAIDRHVGEDTPAAAVEAPDENRAREVDALLSVERMLRTADISNLIRERPVYDFSNPAKPVLVQSVLVVDIAEVGRIAKVNIRKRPWLLAEVTRLLDSRVIAHILREPSRRSSTTSINLHTDTVLSDDFQDFVDRLDTGRDSLPTVELDFAELKAFPATGLRAVERLRATGCRVIVDGIPASALTAGAERLPHISGDYKFDWRNSLPLDAPAFDDAEVKAQVAHELERFGAGNCVLLHCHTPTVIERALAVGFTRIEGFEITKYIESAAYRAAHGAKGRRAARAAA